jgi:hypothetical protein
MGLRASGSTLADWPLMARVHRRASERHWASLSVHATHQYCEFGGRVTEKLLV